MKGSRQNHPTSFKTIPFHSSKTFGAKGLRLTRQVKLTLTDFLIFRSFLSPEGLIFLKDRGCWHTILFANEALQRPPESPRPAVLTGKMSAKAS